MERLKDKVPKIRCEAVAALESLQVLQNDECPVIDVSAREYQLSSKADGSPL